VGDKMSTFTPPDGVWIRRVANGWHVVERLAEEDAVYEKVYEDVTVAMGDESAGLDSGSARSLNHVLWGHFDSYMRSKHRAGLAVSVQPSYSNTPEDAE